jgi:serine protease Do
MQPNAYHVRGKLRNRILPTAIIALVGAIVGSFVMMLYASTHFTNVAGPNNTPPAVSAAPLPGGGSDQTRIVDAVRRVKPSVVAIDVTVNGQVYQPIDPLLQQFFGQQGPSVAQPFKGKDSGSGWVYDSNGDIVTNAHVVRPPVANSHVSDITVIFSNGRKEPAKIVSENIGADLAVIRVNAQHLPPPLTLADSSKLQQGQWAIAIGEPYELQQTVTVGVVSAFNRSEPIQNEMGQEMEFKGLLQTSAPINPGNSGGPLVDISGNLIGVNQSTLRGGAQGIGFAIPANTVREVVTQMLAHPGITQGTNQAYMGVVLSPVNNGFRSQTGYRGKSGVGIIQVVSGSPADQAGLQPGDVILKLDGRAYNTPDALQKATERLKPGTRVTLEIWSQGTKRLAALTLAERPAAIPIQQGQPGP